MARRIQLRRDTAANWVAANPILYIGEIGIDTDSWQFKIGNGVDNWNNLSFSGSGGTTAWGGITGDISSQTDLQSAFANKADLSHSHTESEITDLGNYEPTFSKNSAFNKDFGTTPSSVCEGDDSRLSDSRVPTAHTHTKSEITDFGNYEAADPNIQVHLASSSNPHSVSANDVGNTTAQWNANQINGITVDDTNRADGKILQFNDTSGNLEYKSPPSGGGSVDMKPYLVTGSGTDITTTEVTMALSTEIITNANFSLAANQITVSASGTYLVSYSVVVKEDSTNGAARSASSFHIENGTTVIPQSQISCYNRETSGSSGVSNSFLVELLASDVIQLKGYVDYTATTNISQGATQISIIKVA